MEVFYSPEIKNGVCVLPEEESAHCVRVLRHREGDEIFVIDGLGTLYTCRLTDASPKAAVAQVLREEPDWGAHPYFLEMAVCPTKNNDRYEWFAEKATELGLDVIAPVIGDHSERKVFKSDRLRRILLAASKQSLKGAVPAVQEPVSVRQYIADAPADALKLICCCFEGEVPRTSINDVLDGDLQKIIILIGPEGDFSREEAALAVSRGFIPVHLGPSRLRTETAALTAVEAVYLKCI
ncbi:MAG: 16S rRNA (uracil(1498)-N(3))-methyltransferase [Bacteroidales bacterium]|nr:16S rRNA (uracil(1498)-N(3))-methyltransferase [Bacteroidales bacterium]MBQ2103824.1 16S rRNA (uracil(1498)-N(3))-methyltransferase [Bacteroidales bacterium]MBQ4168947.1 16S rRNA (uracil(1498)-N(3))-methyltransferase [Bacteroidales bacterium]MBQ5416577.1 16S rRNA (uracil(1498)-N(3))-methyltransferase [Bacteroidales bacterium]